MKIKIERPDAESAMDIFSQVPRRRVPVHVDDINEFGGDKPACIRAMIESGSSSGCTPRARTTASSRSPTPTVTREVKVYFKGLQLGCDDPERRRPGQVYAIKSQLDSGQPGLRVQHLFDSILDEFAENEDLPNTTNPDDWARISGKKGERIVFIRTLVTGKNSGASRLSTPRPIPVSICSGIVNAPVPYHGHAWHPGLSHMRRRP